MTPRAANLSVFSPLSLLFYPSVRPLSLGPTVNQCIHRTQLTSLFSTTSALFASFKAHKQPRKPFLFFHFRTLVIKHPGVTLSSEQALCAHSTLPLHCNFCICYHFRTLPKIGHNKFPSISFPINRLRTEVGDSHFGTLRYASRRAVCPLSRQTIRRLLRVEWLAPSLRTAA
jgi:hypothetical protein